MVTKVLVLKKDSSRPRIESKGKHNVATVYGLDKVGSYQPTKDNKPSQAIVKAEELFNPEKEFESGSLVICGVQQTCRHLRLNSNSSQSSSHRIFRVS